MKDFRDFFYYTRNEQRGVIALLTLSLFLWGLPWCFSWFQSNPAQNFSAWENDVAAFEEGLYVQREEKKKRWRQYPQQEKTKTQEAAAPLQPTTFNPNTVSQKDLEAMGLPERTIRSIINYRSKGGQFRKPEDLQKIYTLSDEHYAALASFIDLPKAESVEKKEEKTIAKPLPPAFDFDPNTATAATFEQLGLATNTIRSIINYRSKGGQFWKKEDFKKIYTLPDSVYQHLAAHIKIVEAPKFVKKQAFKPKSYYKIDINTAGLDDFQQFRGIGPSYAKRILKMKEGLGGFASVEQIGELYKLPDSTFQQMLPYLECKPITLQKININTASLEELKAHPYLRWFHAKAIVKYRETEGAWKSVELVQILSEFDDGKGTFEKVKPYLTVE